jgi:hypothetical protein
MLEEEGTGAQNHDGDGGNIGKKIRVGIMAKGWEETGDERDEEIGTLEGKCNMKNEARKGKMQRRAGQTEEKREGISRGRRRCWQSGEKI